MLDADGLDILVYIHVWQSICHGYELIWTAAYVNKKSLKYTKHKEFYILGNENFLVFGKKTLQLWNGNCNLVLKHKIEREIYI